METQSNSSNSSYNTNCKHCNVLLCKENTARKGRKSCKSCNLKISQEREAKKSKSIEGPDTKFCSRCKLHLDKMQFIKFLKQCEPCRQKAKDAKEQNTDKNSNGESVEHGDNNLSLEELYMYFKQKYNIQERLEDFINYIIDAEASDEEQ